MPHGEQREFGARWSRFSGLDRITAMSDMMVEAVWVGDRRRDQVVRWLGFSGVGNWVMMWLP